MLTTDQTFKILQMAMHAAANDGSMDYKAHFDQMILMVETPVPFRREEKPPQQTDKT